MSWKHAGLIGLFVLSVDATMPSTADACGAGVGLRAGRPRKGAAKNAAARDGRVVIDAGGGNSKTPKATKLGDGTVVPSEDAPVTPPAASLHAEIIAPASEVEEIALDSEIYFSPNSEDVRDTSKLDKAVTWLSAHVAVNAVIEGHADPRGNPDANMALSRSRADAVKGYLTSKGVDGSRLEVKAFGDTQLRYGHGDGRNRRVRILPQK